MVGINNQIPERSYFQEYNLQITFRERWLDKRLAYKDRYLTRSDLPHFLTVTWVKDNIWIPDTFFPDLVYRWDTDDEPVRKKGEVGQDLPNFKLTSISTNDNCTSHTTTGSYGCLRMELLLTREFSYYIIQLYGPTAMIVVVSWVSFWIDMHSTAGRVALGVTTLLTMTTLQTSINAKLPPVNYVKLVDYWLGACQAFVFGALLEYAFVSYKDSCLQQLPSASPVKKSRKRRPKTDLIEEIETFQPPCTCHLLQPELRQTRSLIPDWLRKYFIKPTYWPARIDFYARWIAPSGFLLFNLIYWTVCYTIKKIE
ncbi:unnamed protein product [Enterobius vermicularis]|uniref:Neur_chan_memb domain-containing protein n=1 Tax=Enterobius vermicularis TaxID=51028 RepID=A0A0N4V4J6_ENTVE|nr:unnamed protein product [Enterobius vermicularis]